MREKICNIYDKLNSPVREAFKVLRANIQFGKTNEKIKSIAVLSSNPHEGKTTVAINLAISMARSGMKVVLVDADLRKPMLVKHLGSKDFTGLSDYLMDNAVFDEIISYTSIENMHFISCGSKQPNPAEIIGTVRFSDFLRTVEQEYDMTIIDTPSLESVIDSAIISSQTGGSLIVVETGALQIHKARRLRKQLENVNATIIGVVLNKIAKRDYKNYNSYYNNFISFDNPEEFKDFYKKQLKKIKDNGMENND